MSAARWRRPPSSADGPGPWCGAQGASRAPSSRHAVQEREGHSGRRQDTRPLVEAASAPPHPGPLLPMEERGSRRSLHVLSPRRGGGGDPCPLNHVPPPPSGAGGRGRWDILCARRRRHGCRGRLSPVPWNPTCPTRSRRIPLVPVNPTRSGRIPLVPPDPTRSRRIPLVPVNPTRSGRIPLVPPDPTRSRRIPLVPVNPTRSGRIPLVPPDPTRSGRIPLVPA